MFNLEYLYNNKIQDCDGKGKGTILAERVSPNSVIISNYNVSLIM